MQNFMALFFALAKRKPTVFEELYEYIKEKCFSGYLGRYENFEFGTGRLISYNIIIIGIFCGVVLAAALAIYNKRYLGNFVRSIIKNGANSPESAKRMSELGFENHFMMKLSVSGGKTFGKMIRCVEADEYYASMLGENSAFPPDSAQNSEENVERGRGFDENASENAEIDEKQGSAHSGSINNRGRGSEEENETPEERHDRLLRSVKPYKIDVENDHFYICEEDRHAAEFRYAKKGTNWLVFGIVVIICAVLTCVVCYLIPDMLQFIDNFLTLVKK